jgi:hypothetical protein
VGLDAQAFGEEENMKRWILKTNFYDAKIKFENVLNFACTCLQKKLKCHRKVSGSCNCE